MNGHNPSPHLLVGEGESFKCVHDIPAIARMLIPKFSCNRSKIVEVQKRGSPSTTRVGVGEGIRKSFLKVCTTYRILPHC